MIYLDPVLLLVTWHRMLYHDRGAWAFWTLLAGIPLASPPRPCRPREVGSTDQLVHMYQTR